MLSTLFKKAIKWGAATKNPVRDVEFKPDNKRDRWPEQWELNAFKDFIDQSVKFKRKRDLRVNAQLKLCIDLKSLIGLRMGDMIKLVRQMIQEDHLRVQNNKTGKTQRFWFVNPANGESTGLGELLDEVQASPRPVTSLFLFCQSSGRGYSEEGFKSIWQR